MTLSLPSYSSPVYTCEEQTGADGATVLRLAGDLDLFSAPEFQATTRTLLAGGCRRVVVDLGRVEFVDSAGLAALMILYRNCQAARCDLSLVDATGRQENLYALTGLDRILPLTEAPIESISGRKSDLLPGATA
jgi:anti-sigma B factor antagonist